MTRKRILDFKQHYNDWRDPQELLTHLGVEKAEEIDVEAIAEFCRARVVFERLQGCAARLVSHRGHAIITVDRRSHPFRRRFSIAHELGHWMLERGERVVACSEGVVADQRSQDDREREANRYAADLLMPESLFVPDSAGHGLVFATVRDLARRYRTSLTATALRLLRCSAFPSMLIWSRRGQLWKWFRRGLGVPRKIWPMEQPGPETVAYGLLRGSHAR